MVDVAHDRDDRWSLHELALLVGVLRRLPYVVGRVDDLDLLVELVGQHLDRVVRQRLGERGHLTELHQLLDHLGRAEAERLADLFHGGAGVDLRRRLLALRLGRRREVRLDPWSAAPAPASAAGRLLLDRWATLLAARCLRVDYDAPAASATASAAALIGAPLGTLRALLALSRLRILIWLLLGGGRLLRARLALLRLLLAVAAGRLRLRLFRGGAIVGIRGVGTVRERALDVALVDARGSGLHVEAGLLKDREHLLAGDSAFLGYLMNSLLCHQRVKSMVSFSTRIGPRKDRWNPFVPSALSAHGGRGQR